jgi:hypothetical protein
MSSSIAWKHELSGSWESNQQTSFDLPENNTANGDWDDVFLECGRINLYPRLDYSLYCNSILIVVFELTFFNIDIIRPRPIHDKPLKQLVFPIRPMA